MTVESGSYDQATILRRQKIAEAMLSDATKPQEIKHWTQGLAQLGRAGIGGYLGNQANEDAKALRSQDMAQLASMLGGSPATPAAPSVSPAPSPVPATPPGGAPMVAAPMGNAVASAMTPSAPVNTPRPEVMPSAKVWGDKEAEDAGLYEKPAAQPGVKVAQALGGNAPMPAPPPVAAPSAAPAPSGGLLAGASPEQISAIKAGMGASEGSPARAIATALMQNIAVKADAPTDEMREYTLDSKQRTARGEKPLSFFDFKSGLKKAGATNVTTNVDQGENAFAKASGKAQAERFDELAQGGQQAKQMVSDIDTLTELGKNIGTGKGAEITAKIGPWAQAIGVDVKGLSDIQAFEAIVNRVAPSLRIKGSGAQSDFELKNFLKSLPSLGNTPEGNAISAATMKGLQENKIRAAEIGSKALNGEITRPAAEKMLRELPDPMDGYREFMKKKGTGATSTKPPSEGQTATNPATGAKVILKGGQWVPVQ